MSLLSEMRIEDRHRFLDLSVAPVEGFVSRYENGAVIEAHSHARAQLLHALSGVVMFSTAFGRWMVPPDHAMWIPAGTVHSVESLGAAVMRSAYLLPSPDLGPSGLAVLGMTDLMRALLTVCVEEPASSADRKRRDLAMVLLTAEVAHMPVRPLGLPLPSNRRLLALCREFIAEPARAVTIDGWAAAAGMSRRSLTRMFQRETGISLGTWRQQACLFAALPRLAEGESVTAVALDLGYDSVPAFTTMFSRMLGASPRAYFRTAGA